MILAIGCCLYLGTGMLLGIPVYLALTRFAAKGGLFVRLAVASVVSLAIWGFNFYAVLSWLQPLLIGGDPGNWITNPRYLPWWVAAATHLVFGWTIALLYPLGEFTPLHEGEEIGRVRVIDTNRRKPPWKKNCHATKSWSTNAWFCGISSPLSRSCSRPCWGASWWAFS